MNLDELLKNLRFNFAKSIPDRDLNEFARIRQHYHLKLEQARNQLVFVITSFVKIFGSSSRIALIMADVYPLTSKPLMYFVLDYLDKFGIKVDAGFRRISLGNSHPSISKIFEFDGFNPNDYDMVVPFSSNCGFSILHDILVPSSTIYVLATEAISRKRAQFVLKSPNIITLFLVDETPQTNIKESNVRNTNQDPVLYGENRCLLCSSKSRGIENDICRLFIVQNK
jgi:hypothetical protein